MASQSSYKCYFWRRAAFLFSKYGLSRFTLTYKPNKIILPIWNAIPKIPTSWSLAPVELNGELGTLPCLQDKYCFLLLVCSFLLFYWLKFSAPNTVPFIRMYSEAFTRDSKCLQGSVSQTSKGKDEEQFSMSHWC